jgi:hypothetical protein
VREPEPEPEAEEAAPESSTQEGATALLLRALRVVESRGDEDWASNSQLKNQMLRIDPTFNEKALGFSTFTKFLDSRTDVIRIKKDAAPNGPRVQTKG